MRAYRLCLAAGWVAVTVGVLGRPATAQDALPTKRMVEPPVESPPVEPTIVGADPDAELASRFHSTLGATRDAGVREARLNVVRRLAPFDLDWGLL